MKCSKLQATILAIREGQQMADTQSVIMPLQDTFVLELGYKIHLKGWIGPGGAEVLRKMEESTSGTRSKEALP